MADTVTTKVLFNGTSDYVVQLTNRSDGTGESAVVKIDKSTLLNSAGVEPTRINIRKIVYNVDGMRVDLLWDHTSDGLIATIGGITNAGVGEICYDEVGGNCDTGTGDTGDVLLTTSGHTAGDSYTIILHCRLT